MGVSITGRKLTAPKIGIEMDYEESFKGNGYFFIQLIDIFTAIYSKSPMLCFRIA